MINFPVPIHDIFDAQTALSQRVDNPLDGATAAGMMHVEGFRWHAADARFSWQPIIT